MNKLYSYQTLTEPDRLKVQDAASQLLAAFNLGAYTVILCSAPIIKIGF